MKKLIVVLVLFLTASTAVAKLADDPRIISRTNVGTVVKIESVGEHKTRIGTIYKLTKVTTTKGIFIIEGTPSRIIFDTPVYLVKLRAAFLWVTNTLIFLDIGESRYYLARI